MTRLLASTATADDHRVGALALLAGPVAERRLAPRRDGMPTGRLVRLATAVRVVDGVHRDSARLRALALVAIAARLADLDVLVLGIGKRTQRRLSGAAGFITRAQFLAGGFARRFAVFAHGGRIPVTKR